VALLSESEARDAGDVLWRVVLLSSWCPSAVVVVVVGVVVAYFVFGIGSSAATLANETPSLSMPAFCMTFLGFCFQLVIRL
jgi:hypothetical protein